MSMKSVPLFDGSVDVGLWLAFQLDGMKMDETHLSAACLCLIYILCMMCIRGW